MDNVQIFFPDCYLVCCVVYLRFGSPMVLQVPRDSTFSELQQDILHNMIDNLRTGVIQQVTLPSSTYIWDQPNSLAV